mmetsp:Transcript_414/g.1160  ORF Transcript_414/g.1160 Transcript_414/m.1160 type:complete len:91 (+) Transcript_414:1028-1300(+)
MLQAEKTPLKKAALEGPPPGGRLPVSIWHVHKPQFCNDIATTHCVAYQPSRVLCDSSSMYCMIQLAAEAERQRAREMAEREARAAAAAAA